jgi:phosphoglucosamine mutase
MSGIERLPVHARGSLPHGYRSAVVRRYFGTDGVRGVVGEGLTEGLVEQLGLAFAVWARGKPVLIGRDTRSSGPVLEGALARGLVAGGSDVILGGILPTPAVALLAESCGAVVSASHNPAEYNGVKFFGPGGSKLGDEDEEAVEALLTAPPPGGGEIREVGGLDGDYVDLVCERFGSPLDGLRLCVDCANGAMYHVAPRALEQLGAEVTTIAATPDGSNINAGCGATDLGLLSDTVRAGAFDLGVAFDGDGDRLLAVDAEGNTVDGDGVLAVLALSLGVGLVAVTSMTNLGFQRLMSEYGIRVVATDVGDRYVLEALRAEGGVLGGEQSGHVLYLNGHVTGDGLVAAILLSRAVVASGEPLAELTAPLARLPQAKRDVRVTRKDLSIAVQDEVRRANADLGGRGRVLVRPSGTEPVIRVLVEAENESEAEKLCDTIAALVNQELG